MIWSGTVSKVNQTLTLDQPSTNFKYLRIGYVCFGHVLFGLYSTSVDNIVIREYNCSDEALAVNFPEIRLVKTSSDGKTYKVAHRMFIFMSSDRNLNDDSENIDENNWFYISNIYGVGYN